MLAVNHG